VIVSSNIAAETNEFEQLLNKTTSYLEADARKHPNYYLSMEWQALEKDVYKELVDQSRGGIFENTIELHSGHRFPDIVANRY